MSDNDTRDTALHEGDVADAATVGPAAATDAAPRRYRKTRQGYVVSDKMDKTVVVEVEDRVKHPLYGKVLRRSSKVKAHDEANSAGVGDRVLIMETRPLSATKRWRVVEILEKAK
ncbi:MAG: 30S ribosomal protein S17 [Dermatophilaceae bacterium]